MEERRTAAVVIGVMLLGFVIYLMWPKEPEKLSFNGCEIRYSAANVGQKEEIYRVAQNKLALCLCRQYLIKRDKVVADRIFKIYEQYGIHDSIAINYNIDTVIKHRNALFDTLVLAD